MHCGVAHDCRCDGRVYSWGWGVLAWAAHCGFRGVCDICLPLFGVLGRGADDGCYVALALIGYGVSNTDIALANDLRAKTGTVGHLRDDLGMQQAC